MISFFTLFIMLAVHQSCFAQFPLSVTSGGDVDSFVAAFKKGVEASGSIPKVICQPASINSLEEFSYAALNTEFYKGFYEPKEFAVYITRPVSSQYKKLSPSILINIFAKTAARQLSKDGLLNSGNASTLGNVYASTMEGLARRVCAGNEPTAQYQVLNDGLIVILKSQGQFTNDRLISVARILGQEIKQAVKGN